MAASDFYFDRERLTALASELSPRYAAASPFPHVVIDGILPEDVINDLIATYPGHEGATWDEYSDRLQVKLALADEAQMPTPHRHIMQQLNGQVFVGFLEQLTGVPGLIPDPWFLGGGLHQIRAGGLLKVHSDFNVHPKLLLNRRLNALLYLNDAWDPVWGGALELWLPDMSARETSIDPVAGRLVVFSTSDGSMHGHPDPLRCPPERSRRSMAWYYYTSPDPAVLDGFHLTRFRERPAEQFDARSSIRKGIDRTRAIAGRAKQRVMH
jgi:Rps23 Pro-64 3,4-dihydroxylase Tpa1-like proline 4-hydroxylase